MTPAWRRGSAHAARTEADIPRTRARAAALARQLAVRWLVFVRWFNAREFSEYGVMLGFAVALGVLAALGVAAFYGTIDLAYEAFYRWPGEHLTRVSFLAYRPVVTAAGLWLAWWVMRRLGRDHEGMNVPDVQLAVVRRGGELPARPAVARTLASAITIGCGGSAGSEGPVVVLGAALGSWVGRAFRFTPSRVRLLVGCAAGAAISASFNAPLAGAFFALEEILGAFSAASFSPVVIASVVAAVVSRAIFGNHPAFPIPDEYGYARVLELVVFYPLLGLAVAVVASSFVRSYFAASSLATWARARGRVAGLPDAWLPMAGGLLVGLLVFASGGKLVGYGHLAMRLEVFGGMHWYALVALALGSVLATSLTLNTGGSGGVFTPSLFVGAATGGAVGVAMAALLPDAAIRPEAYALVGMGAMVAATTDAPITGILLVFEMTNDYAIMLPLMLTVVIAHVVARRLEPDSLYSGWLRRRGEHIAHGADRDALATLQVRDVFEGGALTMGEGEPVDALLGRPGARTLEPIAVVDDERRLVGMLTAADIGHAIAHRRELRGLVLAGDLATPSEVVSPADSLQVAIRRMGVRGQDAIPVVDPDDLTVLGMLSRQHALAAYERAVLEGQPPPGA